MEKKVHNTRYIKRDTNATALHNNLKSSTSSLTKYLLQHHIHQHRHIDSGDIAETHEDLVML